MPRLRPRFARRILVLNDHPVELALFQNMLAAMGYRRVTAASDAAAAVAAVARQPHDVVISDIATGIAGSASLLTELRGMGRVPPVIWTSGLGEELLQSHVRLALEAGSASVQALPMPVSAAVLQAAMETALESLAASQEAAPAPLQRRAMETALRRALQTGAGFSVVLQPQVDLRTGRVVAAEALSRWRHRTLGEVPPADFVAAAHRLGLDGRLFERVVDAAAGVLVPLHAEGLAVPVAVNASASTLCDPALPAMLERRMARAGLPARLIKIELTEDEPVGDWVVLSSALNLLRVRGFELAMDDFGAGIASMRLFSAMPFTELKIDREFIVHMHRDAASRAVVAAAIDMGRSLGRRVVAEGVEQERDLALLRELGCDAAQGYAIARPLAPRDFVDFCRAYSP